MKRASGVLLRAPKTGGEARTVLRSPAAPKAAARAEARPELRRVPRVPTSKRVTIFPAQDGAAGSGVAAEVCDLSAGGIGLVCGQALKQGAFFEVSLRHPKTGQPKAEAAETLIRLLYRVVRCRPCGEQKFRLGAELSRILAGGRGGDGDGASAGDGGEDEGEQGRLRRAILS